jgi:hypothetical protein
MPIPEGYEEIEGPGAVKILVPKEKLEDYRTNRAKDKQEREALATEAGAARREKKAAEEAKAEADRLVAIEKANKEGDIKKVREIANEESVAKLKRREARVIAEHLRAKITQLYPKVDNDTLEDTIALNARKFRLNADTDEIEVVDAAGQLLNDPKTGRPLTADAVLADFAKTRSHLQKSKAPAGDGDVALRHGEKDFTHTITHAQQQRMMELGTWGRSEYAKAAKNKTLQITD